MEEEENRRRLSVVGATPAGAPSSRSNTPDLSLPSSSRVSTPSIASASTLPTTNRQPLSIQGQLAQVRAEHKRKAEEQSRAAKRVDVGGAGASGSDGRLSRGVGGTGGTGGTWAVAPVAGFAGGNVHGLGGLPGAEGAGAGLAAVGGLREGGKVPQIKPWPEGLARYRDGALRITNTPNRERLGTPNTILLSDILKPECLKGLFESFYCIAAAEHFPHLPVYGSGPHSLRNVPLYVSHDIGMDTMRPTAAHLAGLKDPLKATLTIDEHAAVATQLRVLYRAMLGPNHNAIYPKAQGCVHSKVIVATYQDGNGDDFLLLMIGSPNAMDIDMRMGDNHWWIQTLPQLQPNQAHVRTEVETDVLDHLAALSCPEVYLRSIRDKFDWTRVKVHIFASTPGVKKGSSLDKYGLLRLSALAEKLLPSEVKSSLKIEICAATIGLLHEHWVKQVDHFLRGRGTESFPERSAHSNWPIPPLKIIYPSMEHVKRNCDPDAIVNASNMGCHTNGSNWLNADPALRALFHNYESKDRGRLCHHKDILWLSDSGETLYLFAFGSANLTIPALGEVERLRKGALKLDGLNNFEIGVVIEGKDLAGMLERGSKWQDFVTYERPARGYLSTDKPWNAKAWIAKR